MMLKVLICFLFVSVASGACALNDTELFNARLNTIAKLGTALIINVTKLDDYLNALSPLLTDNTTLVATKLGTYHGVRDVAEYLTLQNYYMNQGFLTNAGATLITLNVVGPDQINTLINQTLRYRNLLERTYTMNSNYIFEQCGVRIQNFEYIIPDQLVIDATNAVGSILELCSSIQSSCNGSNVQYPNIDACMNFMSGLPKSACVEARLQGNSSSCRFIHTYLARYDPDLHCPHTGVSSAGKCVNTDCSQVKGSQSTYNIAFSNCQP
eukprot:NODE_4915_length_1095_cov_39.557613_g4367_i0.p1 GENE.NODE_4915_length_1095_cov_39.557613_g4367_i0~~NODE_4915_length_1095_cov_39.557613_g4367_i0.p1  ORF type:complete len:268 (+),score=33.98 NODE_4915_length_1095_cov_39.557613_g4367_i0:60-863(+)